MLHSRKGSKIMRPELWQIGAIQAVRAVTGYRASQMPVLAVHQN